VNQEKFIQQQRQRRRFRVRNNIRGTIARPRLCVFRSNKNISCQIINDVDRKTLVSASSRETGLRDQLGYGGNVTAATALGRIVAERALAAGIQAVCFDRGHYKYHGRIAALANAAREAGLQL
jgi:large subunit ribosomal protein L18